ncbi:PAS domain containing serine/threonine kinase isoform X2 [Haemaphysalis longicornis]
MAGGAQQQRRCSLSKLRGSALCAFSFGGWGSGPGAGGVGPDLQPSHGGSTNLLSGSWVFYSGGEGASSAAPASLLQPGKAIVTIDAATTQILTANKAACALLGVPSTQVGSRRLSDFLAMKKGQYALTEADVDASGEVVVIAGKVMDLIDSDGEVVPVSVWVRKLDSDSEPRCLVVMEPVQRTTAVVTFDSARGQILSADKGLAMLCGYSEGSELEGTLITDIIPSLVLPTCQDGVVKTVRKQQATGRTRDGSSFPLSILLEPVSSTEDNRGEPLDCHSDPSGGGGEGGLERAGVYRGVVWVFANISGMITVLPDGSIHSCNTNFSLMLFGYTQNQLQGKHITVVIPTFYDDFEYLDTDSVPLPPLDDDEEDSRACAFLDERPDSDTTELCRPLNPLSKPYSPRGSGARKGYGGSRSSSATGDDLPLRLQDLSLTGSVIGSCSGFGRSLGAFQRSTSAAEPLAPLLGPAGEGNVSGTAGDVNGNVASTSTDSPRRTSGCRLKNSLSADVLAGSHLRGDGDMCSSVSAAKQQRLGSSAEEEAAAALTTTHSLRDLAEEEEEEAENYLLPLGETKLPTSDSFHSTSTMTSSTMHSSEENTQEAAGRHRDSRLSSASGAEADEVVNERALQAELKTFRSCDSLLSIAEGSYTGLGRHRDGSHIAIVYQIRRVDLEEGSSIYCLWVSRDLEAEGACPLPPQYPTPSSPLRSLTLGGGTSSSLGSDSATEGSLREGHSVDHPMELGGVPPPPVHDTSVASESEYTSGLYSSHYTTLQQIGKGAYGCVKMAYRNSDCLLVITKFIRKSKVYEESWVHDQLMGRTVPLEVSLLTTLSHPGVVRVLDVFENSSHFQMVMERHGAGMDLFEFIDRAPCLDEPLASYLFRQVVSALSYLHGLNILHRDIKDENIILDERFTVKLIDFGSAAFMAPDRCFTTFCGTVEYCSPEVLQGNPYAGPELEMWALGVTLYTLVFGENPFFDVEETIAAVLKPPCATSKELWELLSWLLHRDPGLRCRLPEVESHPWTLQPVCPESYRFEDVVHATPEEIHPSKYFQQDSSSLYFSCSLYDLSKGEASSSSRHRSLSCASSASNAHTPLAAGGSRHNRSRTRSSSSRDQPAPSSSVPAVMRKPASLDAPPNDNDNDDATAMATDYNSDDIARGLEACS